MLCLLPLILLFLATFHASLLLLQLLMLDRQKVCLNMAGVHLERRGMGWGRLLGRSGLAVIWPRAGMSSTCVGCQFAYNVSMPCGPLRHRSFSLCVVVLVINRRRVRTAVTAEAADGQRRRPPVDCGAPVGGDVWQTENRKRRVPTPICCSSAFFHLPYNERRRAKTNWFNCYITDDGLTDLFHSCRGSIVKPEVGL